MNQPWASFLQQCRGMGEVIYEGDGLTLGKEVGRYFVKYDVGTHQIVQRKDEISRDDAERILQSPAEATKFLFELQRRLIGAGIDPYVSNLPD